MKVTVSALLLTAALGVSAHPSGHAHLHNVRRDFVVANKPVTVTEYATVPAAAAPTSAPAVNANAVAPSSSSSAATPKSSKASSGTYKAFCGGKKIKRATTDEIAYKGNVGADGNYGCNLMEVDSGVADKYKYTIAFENSQSKAQDCKCWNKIGADGGINGFFNGNEALSFTLPASGKAVVAVDDNSQGGCACGVGGIELTSFGQFASTWLEFDMANESNGGWSGADASCLVAAKYGLSIPAMNVCGAGVCSTINEGGSGTNAYLAGMEDVDGTGLNLPAGEVRLTVTVG
ncbi:Fc.00g085290.m01.CDS01 [Cosmosporella sp. VM-42]